MICVLIVGPEAGGLPAGDPAIEVLRARNGDEAVEKLARNRRIDGVLLLCGSGNAGILASILEEQPAPPPIYAPAEPPPPAGVRPLPAATIEGLLGAIVADLSG